MPARRVLVVEDDPRVAAVLVGGLREAGFEIELAVDGESAVQRAMTDDIDVVLLDLMMPGRSGFEILDDLQGRRPMPIIVVSARTDLQDRLRSFRSGAMDFVPKPFWIEEIVARIERLTGPTRPASASAGIVRWANAALDLDGRSLTVNGAEVALTRYQFDLLSYLVFAVTVAGPIQASPSQDPRGGFWVFPTGTTLLQRLSELDGHEIEHLDLDALVDAPGVHQPSSAMTMAGGLLRPVMLVSATPFTTPGATYVTALDLRARALLWKVELAPDRSIDWTAAQFAIANGLSDDPVVVFPGLFSGAYAVGR
jgi:DNA-binding response OmpR family regulator